MARNSRRWTQCFAAVAMAAALVLATTAQAGALDDAKAAGYVGEQMNGFLGLVGGDAPADVIALLKSVNGKRMDHYTEIAQKNGTSVSAVAKVAGEKTIAMTKPGNYVQGSDGGWVKK